jgi:hypothetical protein
MESKKFTRITEKSRHKKSSHTKRRGPTRTRSAQAGRQAGSSAMRQKREGISDGIYLLGVEFGGGFGGGFGSGFGAGFGGGGVWSLWEF